jgi:undecaprenyl-diphosphatase
MPLLPAIIIAILQGVTELFPVSSLGHAVILPALLGFAFDQKAPEFLPFLVVLHVGTAVALLVYFRRDWLAIATGLFASAQPERQSSRRLLALIVVATLPAVVLGFLFEHKLRLLFAAPAIAAGFLVANGVFLFVGERLRRRFDRADSGRDLTTLRWTGALAVGLWQCAAFLPGISRSGTTMVGGLLTGLSHKASAHFSFLIATPVILGAAVLEIPKLMHAGVPSGVGLASVVSGIVAGLTAYASIAFLMRYFGKHEFDALDPFAYYCIAAGGVSLALLLAG